MKLIFNIEYLTVFGEELILNLMTNDDKGDRVVSSYHMSTHDGSHWSYELNGKFNLGNTIDYYYSVESNGEESRHEWLLPITRMVSSER